MEKDIIQISVRNLVEFILRSGDLNQKKGVAVERKAMEKGSKIHKKIQKKMGRNYQAEVPLRYLKEYKEFSIQVEGRADGIILEENSVMIDEIKGMYRDLKTLEEPMEVHLAQAKCYAYFYGTEHQLENIKVQMTYCNLDTEEILRFHREYSIEQLSIWFGEILDAYYQWARWLHQWKQRRNHSMEGLEFPFPYREGQRDVVVSVYRSILRNKQLFIQAPTGVGKTMSTVFPAVRAMGQGFADKIFYLTARTVTGTVAREAVGILKAKGLCCKTLMITSKEKLCILEKPECTPNTCERAKGHFDRVNQAVFHMLQEEDLYDREIIMEYSRNYQVCPYEMCLDLAMWVDMIICDYNYVFDPNVQLRRFFGEGNKGNYIFLVDEAHNLVERGREMYSASLYKEDFLEIKKLIKPYHKKLERALERCNKHLLEMKRSCDTYQVVDHMGGFSISLMNLMGALEDFMEEMEEGENSTKILEFYFKVRHFLNMYDLLDENYVIYHQHDANGKFQVKLFCVNPAVNLQNCLDKGISSVFFSGTLLPIRYYRSLLSGREEDYAIYAKSPFQPEQKCIIIGRDVSSRYTRRGMEEYEKISQYIYQMVRSRKGNYMVFFPSYRMLEDVKEVFREKYEKKWEDNEIQILSQNPAMDEETRGKFLHEFEEEKDHTLIGFCVMGGIFAEGIDLTGEKLIGVAIVGTGIPQVSYEREILKQYYEKKENRGFDYAYRLPGMNKVFQAAGRVIRTQKDRGIILLLDERFCSPDYRNLFPREWKEYKVCTRKDTEVELNRFWAHEECQ